MNEFVNSFDIRTAKEVNAVPCECKFLLLKSYDPFNVTSAISALHAANLYSNQALFNWKVISETGQQMTACNSLTLQVDGSLCDITRNDVIFVCGGDYTENDGTPQIVAWLRKAIRFGATIVSLGGATATLAKTGLLSNQPAAVHWAQSAAIKDQYPDIDVQTSIFNMDIKFITCAGGTATIDMMLQFIARTYGENTALGVADRLVCSNARAGTDHQTVSDFCRTGTRHPKLTAALNLMRNALEEPFSPAEIATEVGISTRQLERLFSRYLNDTPKRYYTRLRIERAYMLLQRTNMKVIEIAMACGFNNQSHFSKVYRSYSGSSPHEQRGVTNV